MAKEEQVEIGKIVVVMDTEDEVEKTFQIVSAPEVNLASGKISAASPIARGLLGKKQGDFIALSLPKGPVEYKILRIEKAPA